MNKIKKLNIVPVGDRILLKRLEEKEQMRGGIIIPDSAAEKSQEAQVVALGSGKRDKDGKCIPFEVKVGDRVIIDKYGANEVKIEGETCLIGREDNILGIIVS